MNIFSQCLALQYNIVLHNNADSVPQAVQVDIPHILPIKQDGPGVNGVEPLEQLEQRCLPTAGPPLNDVQVWSKLV